MAHITDVIVVGAGQSGLVASHLLSRAGIQHLVLERGGIGESWRSQRWDSFHLNTPNWANGLEGMEFHPDSPDRFEPRDRLVTYFEQYAAVFDLPIRQHTPVRSVRRTQPDLYELQTDEETLLARAVVLAAGGLNRPRVPAISQKLPSDVVNLSAGTYKNPAALPAGAAIVVGSGQSGSQIGEELLESGRQVYLCASRVARVPRAYRGRDTVAWFRDLGFWDLRLAQLENPAAQFEAQPQVSGTRGGHTVSLQSLARDGATLIGHVRTIDGHILQLDRTVQECIAFADQRSQTIKTSIDGYIERKGIRAEAPQPDPGEPPLPDLKGSDKLDHLDLRQAGVSSIIWCTGFDADWSWVKVDVFDGLGRPRHQEGVTASPGLYFLGLPWLSARKSGILYGVSDDAARIVLHIATQILKAKAD